MLGLIAKIFHLDVEKLKRIISEKFAGKDESIVNTALMAFQAGYAYPVGRVLSHQYQFEKSQKTGGRDQITMDGNTALAYGLIAAGVRYGAGYPITPWSSVMEILRRELPKYGGVFVQCEDELAAVSMALGFSYSGNLAITGSAGPGISLKTEAIGWASMAEMPLLIVNVQRGGPSTGLPTNVEQSDLFQAIYGGHGDSPRVVLAAETVEDCFYIAIEAARIARQYSTPVFILSDSSLATRIEAFDEPALENLMLDPKPDLTPRAAGFKPYALDRITQHAPPGTAMVDGKYPLITGLEHDEMGHPTGSPKLHMAQTAKRRSKLQQLAASLPSPEIFGDAEGDTLLVGWGLDLRADPRRDQARAQRGRADRRDPPAAFASVAVGVGDDLREVPAHRGRRDERPGHLRFRAVGDDSAGALLRAENPERDQDGRPDLSGARDPGARLCRQNFPGAESHEWHGQRRARSRSRSGCRYRCGHQRGRSESLGRPRSRGRQHAHHARRGSRRRRGRHERNPPRRRAGATATAAQRITTSRAPVGP